MPRKPIRQGDIYMLPVKEVPEGAIKKDNIVQRGEHTGHMHQIVDGEVYIKDGNQYVIARQKTVLVHEEHKEVKLKKGVYLIRRKREYSPLAERQVSD
jgi:hypothetical protein